MTGTPVNLSRERKRRARTERAARANANAARFGQTKAQKQLDKAQANKTRLTLDRHRRDDD